MKYRITAFTAAVCLTSCTALFSGCKEKTAGAPAASVERNAAVEEEDTVVARVGDSEIRSGELARTANTYAQRLMQAGQQPPPDLKASVLDMMVNSELLYQSGLAMDIPDIDGKIEEKYQEIAWMFPSPEMMTQVLAQDGMTMEDLRESLRKDVIVQSVLDEKINPSISVSDKDIEEFYQEHKGEMEQPERIHAHHILVSLPKDATAAQKKEARETISALRKRIESGEDFETVAQENSDCPSKDKGGDLGFFSKGMMVPAFEKAAWDLKIGELSKPVETPFGYHLIRLDEKRAAGITPLDEVRDAVEENIRGEKSSEKIELLIEELKKEIKVEKL